MVQGSVCVLSSVVVNRDRRSYKENRFILLHAFGGWDFQEHEAGTCSGSGEHLGLSAARRGRQGVLGTGAGAALLLTAH